MEQQQVVRHIGDGGALATIGSVMVQWLPPIAALLTVVWTFARLVEMFTGKPFHESRIAQAVVALFRRFPPKR